MGLDKALYKLSPFITSTDKASGDGPRPSDTKDLGKVLIGSTHRFIGSTLSKVTHHLSHQGEIQFHVQDQKTTAYKQPIYITRVEELLCVPYVSHI